MKNSMVHTNLKKFPENVLSYSFVQGRISKISWNQEVSWKITFLCIISIKHHPPLYATQLLLKVIKKKSHQNEYK